MVRIKLVCKAWHETSACVRFKSLSFYRVDDEGEKNENFDLHLNDFQNFLKSTGPMFSGVQRLVVRLSAEPINYENNRMQNLLNGFERLEELELDVNDFSHSLDFAGYPKLTLELKRLSCTRTTGVGRSN